MENTQEHGVRPVLIFGTSEGRLISTCQNGCKIGKVKLGKLQRRVFGSVDTTRWADNVKILASPEGEKVRSLGGGVTVWVMGSLGTVSSFVHMATALKQRR